MAKEIDLDKVVLSPTTVAAWSQMAQRAALGLDQISKQRGEKIEIPDEKARVNDDGTLTIYVKVPGLIDISMDVPADQWAYRS